MTGETIAFQAAAIAKVPGWVSLSGQMAPMAAFVVFMAPYPTIRQIRMDKRVGKMPMLPYSSMVVNCFVWMVYGLLKLEQKVWLTNSIGLLMGLFYSLQFNQFCSPNASNLPGTKRQHKIGSASIMFFTALCAKLLPSEMAIRLIGLMGVFFCVILFGSPLSSLKEVVTTKSAKSIPLPFTVACVINCLLWSIFGTLEAKDFNIYFPNLLGLFLGFVQLSLLAIYGNGSSPNVKLPL